ncbi:hypothetical protein PACTADRAFT_48417 [Pachysolen tannophilus NRRL Y-2460]|uniref:Ubiquinone biosynthesis protein n=1 Tax=Pachysolen tannophilus NRRL Y-2460 TaxID=669874 RepID=A0A1E4TXV3_PACTA|nr:hypothetical protein PACTADRAFT_48417 [Pachysolen tannophilus NRRL Y-2460]
MGLKFPAFLQKQQQLAAVAAVAALPGFSGMALRPVSCVLSKNKLVQTKRGYFSLQHPNEEYFNKESIQFKILEKAIKNYVPIYGFTEKSITESLRSLNYDTDNISTLFNFSKYGSPINSLIYFNLCEKRNLLSLDKDQLIDLNFKNETLNLKKLLQKRLEMNKPILSHYHEALALMILPSNLNHSIDELQNLTDEICYLAGDNSNDFKWYTKRFSIASIYIQSELYMLKDKSQDFEDTMSFMNYKIDEIDKLGEAYNNVEEWTLFNLISLINLIKSQSVKG